MITAIEITRRRSRATVAASDLEMLELAGGRGRIHYIKAKFGDGSPYVHVGYLAEFSDCCRIYSRQWSHVATSTAITDAIGLVAQTLSGEPMPC